nr:hypothetical protein [Tanacetum cinerariifolium]
MKNLRIAFQAWSENIQQKKEEEENDDKSFSDEETSKKIYSNPLFYEEIISIKIDPHHFNAESDLIESLLNQDSSIISSSSKIDSLLEIRLIDKSLYDNSSPRPLEEFISKNSDAIIKSFSPSPIPVEDSDPFMEEIDLFLASDGSIPSGIDNDYSDSEGDNLFLERLLHDDPIPLPYTLDFLNVVRVFLTFFTYPVTSSILLFSGSEDTIFDPGISNYHFSSLEPGSGSLPSNTFANPKGELKSITTRSGIVLDGAFVPIPPLFINQEDDELVVETLTDQDLAKYTIKIPRPLVQKSKPPSQRNFVVHQRDPLHPNIPYPSRMLKQKQQEKDEVQIHKFWKMFK